VQVFTVPHNNLVDIGAVKTFTVLYIDLAPDQFFCRYDLYRQVFKRSIRGMLKPVFVNATDGIWRIENNVDIIIIPEYLRQPAYVCQFRLEPPVTEMFEYLRIVAGMAKDVKVFGVPRDAGVVT